MSGLLSFSRPSDAPRCGGTTCVHPPVRGHSGCLHLSARVAPCTALMWTRVLVSLGRTPSLGAAGSDGNSGYPSEETAPCPHSAAPVPTPSSSWGGAGAHQSEDLTQCSNPSLYQLWPRYQQQHQCQRTCSKCRISSLSLHLLNQNLPLNKTPR